MNNNSRDDIINNRQKDYNDVNYALLNMNAKLNIGNYRKKQEDAVLLLVHPQNSNFKLLAVADGMGGLLNGAKASNIALFEIINWFENLPQDYYVKEKCIYQELYTILKCIDEKIRINCQTGGTTLSIAIISQNNTILLNVGDSRIYIYNEGKLQQISIDHSISWDMFVDGKIKQKDDIRFHRQNHLITSRLGCDKKKLVINDEIIKNMDYYRIFLFSDGITDCLSDIELKTIISNNDNSNLVNLISNAALNSTTASVNLDLTEYYDIICGGKDNQAIATFVKERKK